MKLFPQLMLLGLVILLSLTVSAEELPPEYQRKHEPSSKPPRALSIPVESLWKSDPTSIQLAVGSQPTHEEVHIPALDVPKGKCPVVRFRVRFAGFNGWTHALSLSMNGQPVGPSTTTGESRLLNRKTMMKNTWPRALNTPVFIQHGNRYRLLTVYGSSWDQGKINKHIVSDRNDAYWYVLDISDLIKHQSENHLKLSNLVTASSFGKKVSKNQVLPGKVLLVDNLEVGLISSDQRDELVGSHAEAMQDFTPEVSIQEEGLDISAASGGAVRLKYNGDTFYLVSSWSQPGEKIKYNELGLRAPQDASVSVATRDDCVTITLTTADYRIVRTLTPTLPFIRIRDILTNLGGSDVGILTRHTLCTPEPPKTWHIGGYERAPTNTDAAFNPSAHITGKHAGIGLAVRDSIMRGQMLFEADATGVHVVNNNFALKAESTHESEWSLYVGQPDYWEFVNAIRHDWNLNKTIPGMYTFWDPIHIPSLAPQWIKKAEHEQSFMRDYLQRKHIDIVTVTPWFEHYDYYKPGRRLTREQYKKRMQDRIAKINAVQPDIKVIGAIESFMYPQPASLFKGTLPDSWLNDDWPRSRWDYSHTFSVGPEATKVIDDTPWADSVFRNKDGYVEIDLYYSTYYRDGRVNMKVFPTMGNYWHSHVKSMMDFLFNACSMDGVYIDMFAFHHERSYGTWDGYSADIDPATGAITQKFALLNLFTRDARRDWIKHVTGRGKLFVHNQGPDCKEVEGLATMNFTECEHAFDPTEPIPNVPKAAIVHLNPSIVALGVRPERYSPLYKTEYAQIVQKYAIGCLRHGILPSLYVTEIPLPDQPGGGEYGIYNHLYPMTPIELNEGFVIGKERIITARSKTFHWPYDVKPTCLRFDLRGLSVEGGFELSKTDKGWNVVVNLKDWQETAVIKHAGQ